MLNSKKIAVIGAGWFGCFIANSLINKGYQVNVYEKNNDIFKNASGNNQNRLHLGFHYPRSKKTIEQSKEGFLEFKKELGGFTKKIFKNYYFISSSKKTKTDFKTYKEIYSNFDIDFNELDLDKISFLKNVDGGIKCNEELLLFNIAKKFYKKKLKKYLFLKKLVKKVSKKNNKYKIFNKEYDFVINCSWMQYSKFTKNNFTYEFCLMLKYKAKKKKHPAITIMDGPFFTLYPWDDRNNFGLYSVEKSRVLVNKNFKELEKRAQKEITGFKLRKLREEIENNFLHYYPNFRKEFVFLKYLKSYRTINKNKNDSRISSVENNNNFINVMSGKIDHVFYVLKEIEKYI